MRSILRLRAPALAAALLARASVAGASANGMAHAGQDTFAIGFQHEPAFVGGVNGVQVLEQHVAGVPAGRAGGSNRLGRRAVADDERAPMGCFAPGTATALGRALAYSALVNRQEWRNRARTCALALVVFALAHNLTFLITYEEDAGPALARTGHGPQWMVTFVLVAILAAALLIAGIVRLAQLSRLAGDLDARAIRTANGGSRDLVRHVLRAWLQILGCSFVVFVGAEHLEHVTAGLPAPGLSILGSGEYHFALVVFAVCALAAALVEALYRWRRDVLVALIAAVRSRWARPRAVGARPRTPWVDRHHAAVARHQIAGRAPPTAAR